jgi:hypothetical protein
VLAKLDALEAEYWAAWQRSQQELVHSVQEEIADEISMPRRWTLMNGRDDETRRAILMAFGVGPDALVSRRCSASIASSPGSGSAPGWQGLA